VVRREVLASLVDAIHGEGRTLLLSSHRMDDVERLANRVAFLSGGRIVLEGDAEELRTRAKRIAVGPVAADEPLGDVPGSPLVERRDREAILTYLTEAESAVEALGSNGRFSRVRVLDMNLEDLFVDLLREEQKEVAPCGA
jgi:ABC-2 type transport system ATP-binding protein